ncbi:hypothetical protein [Streptomyces sp. CdTB01]|uniref:hypothetical protein n=1 Tax=Streptomyces sp. CdTB01 TaxID=1725411 RepID=UPI0007C7C029|nr:hypothetical protein [Streptomyces sp. CdTB01]
MSSRPQDKPRGAWRTTRTAVLCPALAVLLAALVICFGYPAHAAGNEVAAALMPMGPRADHLAVTVTAPGGCRHGDVCCAQADHAVRAVSPATAHPLPALLPRTPGLPAPEAGACPLGLPPTRGAPDLHVLQVQRI